MQNCTESKENHHKNDTVWRKINKSVILLKKEKNTADSKLASISTSVHAGGNLFSQCVPLALITWDFKSFSFSTLCVMANSGKLSDHRKLVKQPQKHKIMGRKYFYRLWHKLQEE